MKLQMRMIWALLAFLQNILFLVHGTHTSHIPPFSIIKLPTQSWLFQAPLLLIRRSENSVLNSLCVCSGLCKDFQMI